MSRSQYLSPTLLSKLDNLSLKARMVVEGFIVGLHKSPYHGFSVEFSEHRSYGAGDEIPFEGRIMAVTDIAEALTASDRPYKKAMPLETVYRILRSMSEKGELDNDLVELFIENEIYKIYQKKHENGSAKK